MKHRDFWDLKNRLIRLQGYGKSRTMQRLTVALTMRDKGLNSNQWVVLYDDNRGLFASRAWWMLHYFGHHKVLLLDGGLAGWCAAGFDTSDDVSLPVGDGDFTARANNTAVAHFDEVHAL